jgi:hypothetical protein
VHEPGKRQLHPRLSLLHRIQPVDRLQRSGGKGRELLDQEASQLIVAEASAIVDVVELPVVLQGLECVLNTLEASAAKVGVRAKEQRSKEAKKQREIEEKQEEDENKEEED